MLTFLQLSDIHFRGDRRERIQEDEKALDYEFRKLLIEDAREVVPGVGGISGLLICGDIADKGRGSEFNQASEWLQNLCAAIDLNPWLVWVVPGNHDIDQRRLGIAQQEFQKQIRAADHTDLDRLLQEALRDSTHCDALFEPLENYQEFASTYSCMFQQELFWTDQLDLGPAQLLLRGINSSLICGPEDDEDRNRMVIGRDQATVPQEDGVVHYTMCHHPPAWLLDSDEVDALFSDNVHVRVTGHLHVRELTKTGLGVYLQAGAVSPARGDKNEFVDPCVPRYDIVRVRALNVSGVPHLDVSVQGRVWRDGQWGEDREAGASMSRRYNLTQQGEGSDLDSDVEGPADDIIRPALELRFRLSKLQPYDREQCAIAIGAPIDDVAQAPAHLQVELLYSWAQDQGRLSQLWDSVIAASLTPSPTGNPFS